MTGMANALDRLAIEGHVVVGADDDGGVLEIGSTVGQGGHAYDLAVDPLEGRSVVARGDYGAMAMIAVGDKAHFLSFRTRICGRWPSGRPRAAASI